MNAAAVTECVKHIGSYFSGKKMGWPLLVNAENWDDYSGIRQKLEAAYPLCMVYVSEVPLPNGLPDSLEAIRRISGAGSHILIGLSQALMLRGEEALRHQLDALSGCSIDGRAVVLLDHCQKYLQAFLQRDERLAYKIYLVNGDVSPLPGIRVGRRSTMFLRGTPVKGVKGLLSYLEHLDSPQARRVPEIPVLTDFSPEVLGEAIYSVLPCGDIFDELLDVFPELKGKLEKEYGDEEQWRQLAQEMSQGDGKSFHEVVRAHFGSPENLANQLGENVKTPWLLWLALKVLGAGNSRYLEEAVSQSKSVEDFEKHIYLDLLEKNFRGEEFERLYRERRELLKKFPPNSNLIASYCAKSGIHGREAVYYLTDASRAEKLELLRCLERYDYSREELDEILKRRFPLLAQYLAPFVFDEVNTQLSERDSPFREELTQYFSDYKLQKLTNKIWPDHLDRVERYALTRPYNKLRSRSSFISQLPLRDKGTRLFFFDALGVEYLAFIQGWCEEHGLSLKIDVGRCELPSITEKNKEFLQYFADEPEAVKKIDSLDEIKHRGQEFNYQTCREPLHLFSELEAIDGELGRIRDQLIRGDIRRAVIVSDHGASRLAVIYEHEARHALPEKGRHGGRCCPMDEAPDIPCATYEQGYAVLANYDRFKGSRKANVEVHGGASLEEVLVPIIVLTQKEAVELRFVEPVFTVKLKEPASLVLFASRPLTSPRLKVEGKVYEGKPLEDPRRVQFLLSGLVRARKYEAEVLDGDNLLAKLTFEIKRTTARENDLL